MNNLAMEPDQAVTVVELVVEIRSGAWGKESSIERVVSQATREAQVRLESLLNNESGVRVVKAKAIRVVCPAKVG